MWMAQQAAEVKTADVPDGELQLPIIVANHHILFLNKKASSSGKALCWMKSMPSPTGSCTMF